ncbi:NADH-dependent flavin oxidoreductase [Hymenobacter profundi]|uniref:NADH-dependent flavin oxidoreductase n=1 Tax=Hymenobacter profundi TaxID=1982110 RepID=A0ABS6WUD6_9BACT|nr:NADH-dependent flavin oxidoreductase [Hymenobacter profundi]MBW3127177.1 NADH-dependent flavin oxidoreductase [Hymenobacter profundi]
MITTAETTDLIFQPFAFKRGLYLKNPVAMAPMTTWSSNDDLTISDEEARYYHARVGGVGLVITGCSHVTPSGQGFTDEFASYDDSFLPSLRKLADAAKSGGAPAILQIFHAGNKALAPLIPNGDIVSASTMEIAATAFTPAASSRALREDEIQDIIQAFGQATRRAIEAGFDGVELHGAHGFLLQNFLSPYFNQRTDEWGGSLENRLRFPLAVVQEVQRVIQEHTEQPFLLGYRISPDEPQDGGLRIHDVYELLDRLALLDIDYVHVSLPSVLTAKPVDSQDDQLVVEGVLARVNGRLPVIAAGHIRTPAEARQALSLGLSLVAVGQALVVNPNWLELATSGREDEIQAALQPSKVEERRIPGKLWGIIQVATGWFTVAAE